MIDDTVRAFGGISALVNNAGVTRDLDFFEVDAQAWDQIFAVNARGCFFALQSAATVMRDAGGGSIVNIASIAGKGWQGASNVAYASSKGAVVAMTRFSAAKLGPLGIRVNAVCPGVTETPYMRDVMQARAGRGGPTVDDLRATVSALSSLERITQPSDIASMAMYLASPQAEGITGQSINVDSGTMWD
ncbi:MAG TPA: SDR family oxidoreductase [Aldersonia sp.]